MNLYELLKKILGLSHKEDKSIKNIEAKMISNESYDDEEYLDNQQLFDELESDGEEW